jgi:hypothetical protein
MNIDNCLVITCVRTLSNSVSMTLKNALKQRMQFFINQFSDYLPYYMVPFVPVKMVSTVNSCCHCCCCCDSPDLISVSMTGRELLWTQIVTDNHVTEKLER